MDETAMQFAGAASGSVNRRSYAVDATLMM